MVYNIHVPFNFLGTLPGELFRTSVELILFTFVTYMVLAEYKNDRRLELKYFIYAFAAIALSKFLFCFVIGSVVFLDFPEYLYSIYLPIIDHAVETIALILLANAFIFSLVKNKIIKKQMFWQISFVFAALVIALLSWFWDIYFYPSFTYNMHWSNLFFTMLKIIFLIYPIIVFILNSNIEFRHRESLYTAFLLYLVDPVLMLINIIFFQGLNQKFVVAAFPFPLLSVAVFTRFIYLKLVDKAFLKQKLRISEEKYMKEKELSGLKDKFVSTVSHELRTPLTSINLYSSLLKKQELGSINKKQKEALSVIKEESQRLSGLINDILDLSKIEAKKLPINIGEFDLSEFSKNNSCYAIANEKAIKIINKIPNGIKIKADSERFKQVLINLISNAVKYTEPGGKIILSAVKKERSVEISVQDTGIGIPKDKLDKIFEKFYQAEEYMTREKPGSGLGLTIANEIVKLHGGEINVESEVGKGSTFTVVLPQ